MIKKEQKKGRYITTIIILFAFVSLIIIGILHNKFTKDVDSLEVLDHRYQWWMEYLNYDGDPNLSHEKDVKIAIIDSGIDFSHKDLSHINHKSYVVGEFKDQEVNDDYEHGTQVAGIIGAKPTNKDGVLGLNPNCTIISIDISCNNETADSSSLVEALNIAIEEHADIINISLGYQDDNEKVHEIIKKAYDNGIVIVASAGNDECYEEIYPAKYNEVLSVGSLDKKGNKLYESSNHSKIVYLPGENIVSTYSSLGSEEQYKSMDGTSLSTPILTGIISLIYQQDSNVTSNQIYDYFNNINNTPKDINSILDSFRKG